MSTPLGQSYAARVDGPEAAFMGDPGIERVCVRRLANGSIEKIDRRGGKDMLTNTMQVSADGRVMTVA